VKTCTSLFPNSRINKVNIFFLLLFEGDVQLCLFSLFQLCWEAPAHLLCRGLAALSGVFAPTLTTSVHPLQECSPRPWEVLSVVPSATFQGRAFIKSMPSMKEEADAGSLGTNLSSSWHMVGG